MTEVAGGVGAAEGTARELAWLTRPVPAPIPQQRMRSPERREVMRLLGSMHRFEVTEQVAWRASTLMRQYRRSHSGIGPGDYLIAGTALTEGLELATLNVRHYPMSQGIARPF